jgi:hypothetical protein
LNETVNTVGAITQNQYKRPGSTTVDWSIASGNDFDTGAIAIELNFVPDDGGVVFSIT